MVLDSNWAEFNCYKIALAIPMLLAAALISYISYQFFWVFLPDYYKVSVIVYLDNSNGVLLVELVGRRGWYFHPSFHPHCLLVL